ncbi:MAG: hypothetical protein M1275_03160 [Patescibacteria group bacterium]|nr:hypothetical protein [Patescibacteria group bacterium]
MTPKFIKIAGDLQTKHRAICDGFLAQALQKTEKAEPFVEDAKFFYKALKKVKSVEELLTSPYHGICPTFLGSKLRKSSPPSFTFG